jgi:hypothetical protein
LIANPVEHGLTNLFHHSRPIWIKYNGKVEISRPKYGSFMGMLRMWIYLSKIAIIEVRMPEQIGFVYAFHGV